MTLPVLDTSIIDALKKLRDNVKNDIDQYHSMDQIQELVVEHRLVVNAAYKPLLKSVCDLLREKGYPETAKALEKDWRL
jgi:DNA-binding protein Fis